MNAPDDREQRRLDALQQLHEAARKAGLTADVFSHPTPLVLFFRKGGELAGTYRSDGFVIVQPGNLKVKCHGGWREAVLAAAGL